jgi:hypothetical protein
MFCAVLLSPSHTSLTSLLPLNSAYKRAWIATRWLISAAAVLEQNRAAALYRT